MANTFELRYNLTGSDRKRLVTAMVEATGCTAKYKGAPTFAYEVDYFTIDKNGTVSFDDRNPRRAGNADSEEIERLIERLHEQGFEAEPQDAPDDDVPEEAGDSLVISYPRKDISDAALENHRERNRLFPPPKLAESEVGLAAGPRRGSRRRAAPAPRARLVRPARFP